VPQLARTRGVSRQHVQLVIDSLRRDRLVEVRSNPAHRRSPLIRATVSGHRMVRKMDAFDAAVLGSVGYAVSARNLELAARTLQRVREALEIGNWRAALPRAGSW
jgi:DNA-binding MarR family transcriptional regulator